MSLYRDQLEAWLAGIKIDAGLVIDVGGSANPVKSRLGSFKASKYLILDNKSEELFHEKWSEPDEAYDIQEDFPAHLMMGADVIFCLEVAEYLYDPLSAIRNMWFMLKKEGKLYMSFPAIYPVHNPAGIDHLRYTRFGVEALLTKAGFYKLKITPRVATAGKESLAAFYRQEGMHPVKDSVVYDIGYMVEAEK